MIAIGDIFITKYDVCRDYWRTVKCVLKFIFQLLTVLLIWQSAIKKDNIFYDLWQSLCGFANFNTENALFCNKINLRDMPECRETQVLKGTDAHPKDTGSFVLYLNDFADLLQSSKTPICTF